jgi:putative flippase GtrA
VAPFGVACGFVGHAARGEIVNRLVQLVRSHGITKQLVRYGIVAASGYVLAIVLYSLEIDIGIAPYLALGIAFVLNGIYNFTLVRLWAFPPSGRGLRSDFGRFCVAAGVSFLVNYAAFAVLYSSIGLDAKIAQRLAVLIAAPVTFLINKHWSFRASAAVAEQPTAADRAADASVDRDSVLRV